MTLVCDLSGSVGHLTNKQEIFYAFIALAMANTVTGVIYRAEKNKWDFSFTQRTGNSFEWPSELVADRIYSACSCAVY